LVLAGIVLLIGLGQFVAIVMKKPEEGPQGETVEQTE